MKTKIIVNKLFSPGKICLFTMLAMVSFQAKAEYYVANSCCGPTQVIVVHKTIVKHHYAAPKKHIHRTHHPKRHYAPAPRCRIWIPDQCGCCGSCVVGHWESCRRNFSRSNYPVAYSNDLSHYDGEWVDDRRTADDICPDMNIDR